MLATRKGGSLRTSTDRDPMITHTQRLDVRPILASGREPFDEIMRAARGVPVNGVMVLIAPFDPKPLRDVLRGSGFSSVAVARGPQEWEITFVRAEAETPAVEPAEAGQRPPIDVTDPAQDRTWIDAGGFHVNARGLAPQAALHAVLEALDAFAGGGPLVAHLDRNIDALFPELARRDCEALYVPGEGSEVRLEIRTPR